MRITLIDNLTIVAHSQHRNSTEDALSKLLMIIPYIQYISLLTPQHGWQYWKYKDGASSYFTITPFFEFQNNFIYYPFTIFSLIILLGVLFYLSFFSLELNSKSRKANYQEGRTSLLCSIILFSIQTLQIPCFKFYIQQIIVANRNNQTNQLIINMCTLILYFLYVLVCEYFLRIYSFTPYHPMQQKFTKLRSSVILFNLIAIVLTLDDQSKLYNLIGLLVLHLIFVTKCLNYLYFQSDIPSKNMMEFQISFALESLAILITLNVASKNKIFPEEQIAIYIMFVLSLGLIIGNHLFSFLYQYNFIRQTRQLNLIYELYSCICNINSNSITRQHILIFQLINNEKFSKFKQKALISNKSTNMSDYYKLGLYLITEMFIELLNEQKNEIEETQLLFVTFLVFVRKKPLVAYVQFKRFEQNVNYQKSYYYCLIKERIDLHLQKRIQEVQKIYQNKQVQQLKNDVNNEKRITTLELYQFCQLEEYFQKALLDIIQYKISIWKFQIQGCQSIYEFQTFALPLSKKIIDCILYLREQQINVVKEEFIKSCEDVLTLKICSMFHSFVLNDYCISLLCEQKISDLITIELQQKTLSRSNILNDNTVLVILSMVKQLGQILNINKSQLANYFGYSVMEINQIINIRELMPLHFGQQHDRFLQSYIKEAKTDLVFKDVITFGRTKTGFLIPQYINIYNNYNILDDFTLIGGLTKITDSQNYLLFDEYGRIIGITQEMSKFLIPKENLEFFLQNIDLFYVYMFLPHIHLYISDMLSKKEETISQKSVVLYVYQDLVKLSKIHESIFSTFQAQSLRQIEQTNKTITQFEHLSSMIHSPKQGMNQRLITELKPINQQENPLAIDPNRYFQNDYKQERKHNLSTLLEQKEQQMGDFLNAIEELQKSMYQCTAKIRLVEFGKKVQKQYYFIFDCSDFIDKSNLQDDEKKQFIAQQSELRNVNNRNCSNKQSQYKSSDQQMDSSIASPIYSQMQQQSCLGQHSNSNQIFTYGNKRGSKQIDALAQVESESFHEVISNDINQNNNNEHHSNQGALLKSQSSGKSGSSSQTAIEIVNKFKTQTSLISSLTIVSILKIIIILLFIIFMSINLVQVRNFNNQVINFISEINLPINFNKYFLNVFTHSWMVTMKNLNILNTSQFIENQLEEQSDLMKTTFLNLTNMYGSFISLEESHYLDEIQIIHLDENLSVEDVEFTAYLYYLEQAGFRLTHSEDQYHYLSNLLKYRINFGNIINNNEKVITSLSSFFEIQQNEKISTFFNSILIQIIVIGIVILSQLFFWKKIELYCQRILMLSNRLSEKAAETQISKFKLIITVIKQLYGEFGFKQRNCCKLCYSDFQQKRVNLKSLHSKKQRESIFNSSQAESYNKKSTQLTIPLNSRIQSPSIKLILESILVLSLAIFVILYFLGSYLIYIEQSSQLSPTQELAMDYISFYIDFENTVAILLILKSELQIYNYMKEMIPSYVKIINDYENHLNTIPLLLSVYNFDHSNFNDIYNNIIQSDSMNGEDEVFILGLYNGDFCQLFYSDIPFCNKNLSKIEFQNKYGQFYNKDNNSEYLSKGISGMVSKMDNFLASYYETEIQTGQSVKDFALLNSQINTQDFNNIIIQYQLDTFIGFEAFIARMQECIIQVIHDQQDQQNIYQILVGVIFILFLLISSAFVVVKVNLRLIYIRLLITLLPLEIMLDIYTISLLKLLR
ncbi:unnamed protein product [Paramecium octaurelia]|uniref:Transmembrane protein n=1 Tax=Paramecium octaurelia TaxID=43137 RepID=A0A8S1YDV4_PAROT|nr:unnamed protein product [Paramecium octaurelia]